MKRIDQAVIETREGTAIVSRDQLLGLLEAVQCGKVTRDDAAKRLERWIHDAQTRAAKFVADRYQPGMS